MFKQSMFNPSVNAIDPWLFDHSISINRWRLNKPNYWPGSFSSNIFSTNIWNIHLIWFWSLVSILVWFGFVSIGLVSFRLVSFRLVSFRFDFVLHFTGTRHFDTITISVQQLTMFQQYWDDLWRFLYELERLRQEHVEACTTAVQD
jgi:hypothetical protein